MSGKIHDPAALPLGNRTPAPI